MVYELLSNNDIGGIDKIDKEFEMRWNYAERRYDRELKGSAYKQQHQPLGGFAAKYGGFASPPRY